MKTKVKPEIMFTNNSKEFIETCQDLQWNHDSSTPHRSETNGVTERAVRRVKEGIAIAPVQNGLPQEWVDFAMECCCYLLNVHDKMTDSKTAFEKRYGEKFDGSSILFGALFEYIPITTKDKSSVHQFEKKTMRGIFQGYVLRGGRG